LILDFGIWNLDFGLKELERNFADGQCVLKSKIRIPKSKL